MTTHDELIFPISVGNMVYYPKKKINVATKPIANNTKSKVMNPPSDFVPWDSLFFTISAMV